MQYLTYFRLELKRCFLRFPLIVAGTALFVGLIGLAFWYAGNSLYTDSGISLIRVGVNVEEGDTFGAFALNLLESMDSVSGICTFVTVEDEESGIAMVESGELGAFLCLPEDYAEGLLAGEEAVTIYLSADGGDAVSLLKTLTAVGSMIMESAQIGYASGREYLVLNGIMEESRLTEILTQVDSRNLLRFFGRTKLFDTSNVSATGELTIAQFYGNSAVVLVLCLIGIPAAPLFSKKYRETKRALRVCGIGEVRQTAAEIGARLLLYLSLCLVGYVPWVLCRWRAEGEFPIVSFGALPGAFLTVLCAVLLTDVIYQWASQGLAGAMFIFVLSFGMLYCSGGFLPTSFLPDAAVRIGKYLPTTAMLNGMAGIFAGSADAGDCLLPAVFSAGFFVLSVAGRRLNMGISGGGVS